MRPLDGTRVIIDRTRAWITADTTTTAVARGIGIITAGAAGVGVLTARPVLWWPVAGGWMIAAMCQRPAGTGCDCQDGEPFDPAWFTDSVRAYMAARGRDRAFIAELAGSFGVDTLTVREWARLAGVQVHRTIRIKGEGSNAGIYLKSLPDPSPTAPFEGVAAGQSSNSNSNGAPISAIYPDPERGPHAFKVVQT